MRGHRGAASRAIPALDRLWSPAWVATVVGPVTGVTCARLHARWEEIRAQAPSWWPSRWPGPFASDVDGDPLEPALALLADHWSGHPLRAFVGRDTVAVLFSHGVGDGATTRRLVADLLAPPGTPSRIAAMRAPTPHEVARGALRQWGRAPARALAAGRAVLGADGARPGDVVDVDVRVRHRRLDAADLAAIRARRDRERPGTSVSMTLLDSLLAQLRHHDVRIDRLALASDVRRYLPGGSDLRGNLVSVLHFAVDGTPWAERVPVALRDGQPLAQYLGAVAYSRLVRGTAPGRALGDARTALGWSDRGEIPEWSDLEWAPGARRVISGLTCPVGRRIGVHLARVEGELHLSAGINGAVFDVERVTAALDATVDAVRGRSS